MPSGIGRARKNGIEVITLEKPPVNAMDLSLTEELAETFAAIASDDTVRAVVLTGAGKSFCAGLDLKIVPEYDATQQRRLLDALNKMFLNIYACPIPVVGAINGHAIAGGLVLALCCDWRVVTDGPLQAGLAEVRVGIPYPVAAIEVVRNELPPQIARRLVLSGDDISGAEALASGLFDESAAADRLLDTVQRRAERYAESPRIAFAKIKRQLRETAISAIEMATVAGRDPLCERWLSNETLLAVGSVRDRSSHGGFADRR